MSQTTSVTTPTQSRRYRWRLLLAVCIGLVLSLAAGFRYLSWAEEREFQEVLAEIDRRDPGWRLEDIEKARAIIPDEDNAALVVVKIHAAMGNSFLAERWDGRIEQTPLNGQLDEGTIEALQEYIKQNPEAAALADRLADMPRGRFPGRYDPFHNDPDDRVNMTRSVVGFLRRYGYLAAAHGDDVLAARLCRSELNATRSLGGEAAVLTLVMRMALIEVSVLPTVERVLAMTAPPPAELEKLQDLLEREIEEPRLTAAIRGERAIIADDLKGGGDDWKKYLVITPGAKGWQSWLPDWVPGKPTINRANQMRAMNDLLDASQRPIDEQLVSMMEKRDAWQARDAMLPGFQKAISIHIRNQAKLRSAVVAVAAERFRHQQNAWPESLDALVKSGQLKMVPVDPYDGQPLRYRQLGGGIVVYSVNEDGVDDGGAIDRNPNVPGSDIGVRLWNVESRRKTIHD
jgi:hypothetical protein